MPIEKKKKAPAKRKRSGPPRGQNYKWGDEVERKVLLAIQQGATYKHAAAFAGVSEDTLKRHRDGNADFAARLARTRDEQAVLLLTAIDRAAMGGDWRAAAAKLRMMYGDLYNDRIMRVSGDPDAPLRTVDDTDAVARAIIGDADLSARFSGLMADVAASRERAVGPRPPAADEGGRPGRSRARDR